jgi:FAD/FMN-containing dehydrogenase
MTTTVPSDRADLRGLVASLRGEVSAGALLLPEDPGFAPGLAGFNLALTHRPDAVLLPGSATDVAAAVGAARAARVAVRVLGAGHGTLEPLDGGLAVVTAGLAGVEVDVEERTARVGAGTLWQQVLDATAPHGLAPLAGSSPLVGVVGYVLGGGLGPVARTFGYAADHVRSFEVVDGTGRLRQVDADHDPELFWALRGGKVGLGVVTALTIDLLPVRTVHAGGLYFPADEVAPVLHAWLDWTRTVPETVTSSAAILRLPDLPGIPGPLRGRLVLHVRFAHVGEGSDGERLVAPLRGAGTVLVDSVGPLPYSRLGEIHADPVDAMPYAEGGALLDHLDHDGLDALLAVVGADVDVPLAAVELRHLGGALSREPRVPNAVPGRSAGFGLHVVGAPVPELLDVVVPRVVQGTIAAMAPWLATESLPNFVGRANEAGALASCWLPGVAARLDAVRATVDPEGLLSPAPRR